MHSQQWKSAERRLANLLGGVRIPVNGRGDMPDIEHPTLSIEVKHRPLPKWIRYALEQARRVCGVGKTPIAVIHEPSTNYLDSIVLIRLGDFIKGDLLNFDFKDIIEADDLE